MLPPESGPIIEGPPAKAMLRYPFRRSIIDPRAMNDDITHPAWNGGLVEPSRTFEDGSVLPGGQAPAIMGRPGAVVVVPAAALARDLAVYRGMI